MGMDGRARRDGVALSHGATPTPLPKPLLDTIQRRRTSSRLAGSVRRIVVRKGPAEPTEVQEKPTVVWRLRQPPANEAVELCTECCMESPHVFLA